MFNLFRKKEKNNVIGSPVKGKAVPLKEVSDPTFAEEMLGKGAAVIRKTEILCSGRWRDRNGV